MSKLHNAFKFFEHVTSLVTTYFEILPDLEYLREVDDRTTARQYIRQLVLPNVQIDTLTSEQTYIRDLVELSPPIIEAQRAAKRIASAKARASSDRASTSLTSAARDLAHEAYHFRERIKAHMSSLQAVHRNVATAKNHANSLSIILRRFDKSNDRVLRHRNFLVHGPKGRIDEFADLRLSELAAIVLHSDLWFEQKNVFDEYQRDWKQLSRALINSMEEAIALVQIENENAIANRLLTFTPEA